MAIGLAVTVKLLTNKELAYIGPVLSTEVIIIIIIIIIIQLSLPSLIYTVLFLHLLKILSPHLSFRWSHCDNPL